MMIPVTCPNIDVVFDAPDTEADDYDTTWVVFEILNDAVGA